MGAPNGMMRPAVCLMAMGAVLLVCGSAALASIEREPIKVDHRNKGPRYDIDNQNEDVERTRVVTESNPTESRPPPGVEGERTDEDDSHQEAPMISIRRIFLVPVMSPSSSSSSPGDTDNERDPMRLFRMPARSSLFSQQSPFSSTRHLFGGDEASRPQAPLTNSPDESQERPVMSASPAAEQDQLERLRPGVLFDPIEMLMEAMRQALNRANIMPPAAEPTGPADLSKEASADKLEGAEPTAVEKAADKKPQSFNSTKEDVVEIEGKKYLRKTVINRHVGDGIMFMTRRLIFSPLNETDTINTTETPSTSANKDASIFTTTTTTTTTTADSQHAASSEQPPVDKKNDEKPAGGISSLSSAPTKEPVGLTSSESPSSSTTVAPSSFSDQEGTSVRPLGEQITDSLPG